MKHIFFLIIIFTFSLSIEAADNEYFSKFIAATQQCMENNKVDDSILSRVLEGEMVDDKSFDCFVACLLEKLELIGSDGSLNTDAAISKIPADIKIHDQLEKVVRTCSTRKGEDKCSTAHMLFVCLHENDVPALLLGS
ncbi:hypothetical protein HCN44_004734 [Aphidius gifuensis]|uniref:Odorant-binding protein n=1 Tax=Aphidius gifuensis TaxID=684658 RepID=A0A3Q9EJW1_APHGI|nr:general odorant-binding protein 69a-like [Aphidius gifuensis]AZQ24991.1 odorant-binding protein [Aphidius gifuensis]KAF7995262.1 hypothetical protein HCN44_004734 [Aphidius gifuensis]